jgi:hypothetical protein
MSATATALPTSPLAGFQKYFDLAATAAIATQQIAANASGETKLGIALSFVNLGLGVVANIVPGAQPILQLASGLESPFASLITGIVQMFKAHGLHGFTPSATAPTPAQAAQTVAVPKLVPAAAPGTPLKVQVPLVDPNASWDAPAAAQAGG